MFFPLRGFIAIAQNLPPSSHRRTPRRAVRKEQKSSAQPGPNESLPDVWRVLFISSRKQWTNCRPRVLPTGEIWDTQATLLGDAPLLPGPNLYEDEPTSNVSCCAFPKRTPPTYTLTGFQVKHKRIMQSWGFSCCRCWVQTSPIEYMRMSHGSCEIIDCNCQASSLWLMVPSK